MTQAVIVKLHDIDNVWQSVKHYIARCDHERFNSDDVYNRLKSASLGLVLVKEEEETKGACIYKVSNPKTGKILITILGGDGANWNNAIKSFSAQLKELGFKRLEIQGRRGWAKALNEFEEMHTTIGKDL